MRLSITICFTFLNALVFGQISDTTASAIKALLLHEKVAEKIFFEYDVQGSMPAGNYAFICPDTTFQRVYKGILDEFPYSLATDGLIYKRKFYADSVRAIYVNGILDFSLYIVFRKISVTAQTADIVFFTTSGFDKERFKGRYVTVTGHLRFEDGKWLVRTAKIEKTGWVEYFKMKTLRPLNKK